MIQFKGPFALAADYRDYIELLDDTTRKLEWLRRRFGEFLVEVANPDGDMQSARVQYDEILQFETDLVSSFTDGGELGTGVSNRFDALFYDQVTGNPIEHPARAEFFARHCAEFPEER